MGGGRPAERRFTVGGSSKSVARCHRTVLAYWKFESISLQRGVMRTLSPSEYSGIGGRVHKGLPIESKPPTTAPTAIQQIVDLLAA
jgi:hypothetical protein